MPSERTALITGGMGCLGEAIAQALHDAGLRVIVTHSPGRDDVQGGPGFILLATRVDAANGNDASGEELQDHACTLLTGAGAALERVR